MDLEEVGRRFSAARLARGWTQEDLAARVGLAVETIGRLERGRQMPALTRLSQLAEALGRDLGSLLSAAPPKRLDALTALLRDRTDAEIDLVTEVARVILDRSPRAARPGGSRPRR